MWSRFLVLHRDASYRLVAEGGLMSEVGNKKFAQHHFSILDGWRAIAILLVLAGHMFPMGPKFLRMNEAVAAAGMAVFFILSGFLITTTMLRDPSVPSFLIKRIFRIVPLAWSLVLFVIIIPGRAENVILANLLFYANFSESFLVYAPHLWSISLEMQFYMFTAVLVAIFGRRSLYILPVLGGLVTVSRVLRGAVLLIGTFDRVDEILAGATLALILFDRRRATGSIAIVWLAAACFVLLLLCSQFWVRTQFPALAYLRPYIAASLVALSFSFPQGIVRDLLSSAILRYISRISYALYIIHPLTYSGWLGSGDVVTRYSKRIVSVIISFASAHVISRYFERPLTDIGHRLAKRYSARKAADAAS